MNLPIFLFTDFGSSDLYVGQVKAVLGTHAPQCPVIDLLNDAPAFDIVSSAHLISALVPQLPVASVVFGVVDPGVGGTRGAVALEADGRWFVGPDNGLFSIVSARSGSSTCFGLEWLPTPHSGSFHGRDLFAPAAAAIASSRIDMQPHAKSDGLAVRLEIADLPRIIYIDHYGNLLTGLRAIGVDGRSTIRIKDEAVRYARVFSEVHRGELFWYENSIGLVEIAANQASAARMLGVGLGQEIGVEIR